MEHYIELIDGTHIEAFPKAEQPENIKEDNLALDTTGEYLQIGRRKRKPKHTNERDAIAQQRGELLCRNLHRLIAESDKILADSRMFLAPVPIKMDWHISAHRASTIQHLAYISSGGDTINALG